MHFTYTVYLPASFHVGIVSEYSPDSVVLYMNLLTETSDGSSTEGVAIP